MTDDDSEEEELKNEENKASPSWRGFFVAQRPHNRTIHAGGGHPKVVNWQG